ncbi:MAG: hypothetical protein DWP95_05560 [Proteobacteria bacterium]|nr:MAG: hypothetical protein DWP95_05560 [Pseudomonadota bacterium]
MINGKASRPQFAPLYSRKERWRIFLWVLMAVGILAVIMFVWVLPWLEQFLPTAHCQTIYGINGLTLVMVIMLVASPVTLALFLIVTEGPKSWWVFRSKQTPLPGEKVMRPTRYRYGTRALWRPFGFLLVVILLLALAVWAYVITMNLTGTNNHPNKSCDNLAVSRVIHG